MRVFGLWCEFSQPLIRKEKCTEQRTSREEIEVAPADKARFVLGIVFPDGKLLYLWGSDVRTVEQGHRHSLGHYLDARDQP
jgi:hypothetical protein